MLLSSKGARWCSFIFWLEFCWSSGCCNLKVDSSCCANFPVKVDLYLMLESWTLAKPVTESILRRDSCPRKMQDDKDQYFDSSGCWFGFFTQWPLCILVVWFTIQDAETDSRECLFFIFEDARWWCSVFTFIVECWCFCLLCTIAPLRSNLRGISVQDAKKISRGCFYYPRRARDDVLLYFEWNFVKGPAFFAQWPLL